MLALSAVDLDAFAAGTAPLVDPSSGAILIPGAAPHDGARVVAVGRITTLSAAQLHDTTPRLGADGVVFAGDANRYELDVSRSPRHRCSHPFCFGAVAGGIASGRVPTAGHGDSITSWVKPTGVLGGVLAVLSCGYLAAIFLIAEAAREGPPDLERWARRRAVLAALAAGTNALVGVFVLQ